MWKKPKKPPDDPIEPTERLILEVPEGGNLDKVLRLFAGALQSNTQVLTAMNNLTSLVKEKFMGLKEDNELLNQKLDDVDTATNAIAADVTALKEELKILNENTNVNLGPAIAKAESIAARLTGIAGPNPGSDPENPPEDPPV